MELTILIPTYTGSDKLERMTYDFATTYKQQGAKIIICEDGQRQSKWLMDMADVYIYNKDNVGFTKNVNRGWKYAIANGADYVGIVNSDTYWISGNLDDLCIPNMVTSPKFNNQDFPKVQLRGSFFVVPKTISDEIGYLDESMKMFCSDQDYADKTSKIFKEVDSVVISHLCSESFKSYSEEQHNLDHLNDNIIYNKKNGIKR